MAGGMRVRVAITVTQGYSETPVSVEVAQTVAGAIDIGDVAHGAAVAEKVDALLSDAQERAHEVIRAHAVLATATAPVAADDGDDG